MFQFSRELGYEGIISNATISFWNRIREEKWFHKAHYPWHHFSFIKPLHVPQCSQLSHINYGTLQHIQLQIQ